MCSMYARLAKQLGLTQKPEIQEYNRFQAFWMPLKLAAIDAAASGCLGYPRHPIRIASAYVPKAQTSNLLSGCQIDQEMVSDARKG